MFGLNSIKIIIYPSKFLLLDEHNNVQHTLLSSINILTNSRGTPCLKH